MPNLEELLNQKFNEQKGLVEPKSATSFEGLLSTYADNIEVPQFVAFGDLGIGKSKYDEGIPVSAIKEGSDLENIRGQRQPTTSKIANGLGRLVTTTGTKALEGLGYTATAIPALLSGDISVMTDNTWSQAFSNLEEDIKEQMPVYKTNKYLEGNILDQMGTPEFWTDDVIDGLAFMASAMLGSYGINAVGKAAKLSNLFPKAVKAAKTGVHKNISTALKKFAAEGELLGMSLFNSVSEAGFEAKDIKDQVLSQLQKQVDAGTLSPEEANKRASNAARNTFLANMVALMPSNYISNSLIFKSFKGGKNRLQTILTDGKYAGNEVKDLSRRELFGVFGKNALKSVLSEGVWEENIQTAVQNYETQLAVNNENQKNRLLGYANEWVNNFTTDEGQKSIVLGAIIGLIPGGVGGVKQHKAEHKSLQNLKSIVDINLSKLRQGGIQDFYKHATIENENGEVIETSAIQLDEQGNPILDEVKVANAFKSTLGKQIDLTAALEALGTNKEVFFDFMREKKFVENILHFMAEEGAAEALDNEIDFLAQQEAEDLQRSGQEIDTDYIENLSNEYKQTAKEIKQIYDTIINYQIPRINLKKYKDYSPGFREELIRNQLSEAWNQSFWQKKRQDLENKKSEISNQPIFRGQHAEIVESKTPGSIENLKERLQAPFDRQIKEIDGLLEESYERYKVLLDENKQTERFDKESKLIEEGKKIVEEIKKQEDNRRKKEAEATGEEAQPTTTDDIVDKEDNIEKNIVPSGEKVQYYDEEDNLVEGEVVEYNEEDDEYVIKKDGKNITISAYNIQEEVPSTTPTDDTDDTIDTLNEDEIPEDLRTEEEADEELPPYVVVPYGMFKRDERGVVVPGKGGKPITEIRNKKFHEYIINPEHTLENATIEFQIDFSYEPFWKGKDRLKEVLQKGEKVDKKTFDWIMKVNKNSTDNVVDKIPLKMIFKDGDTTIEDLYYSETKGVKDIVNKHYRTNRINILTQLLNGNNYITTGLKKTTGKVNYGTETNNIATITNTNPNDVKVGVVGKNSQVNTGKQRLVSTGNPGQVWFMTNATATKKPRAVRANVSRLSEQHANILFRAIQQAYTKGRGGYRGIFEHPDVEGSLTVEQVIEFLALFGDITSLEQNKDLPSYLLAKQLFVSEGKWLHFGEQQIPLQEAEQEHIDAFIKWATNNKNYAVNRKLRSFGITLDNTDSFDKSFKIGNITVNKGDRYSSTLITNNIITTNVQNINGSVTFDSAVSMDLTPAASETKSKVKEQPKEQPKKTTEQKKVVTELKQGKNKITTSIQLSSLPVGSIVSYDLISFDEEDNEYTESYNFFELDNENKVRNIKIFDKDLKKEFEGKVLTKELAKKLLKGPARPYDLYVDVQSVPEVESENKDVFEGDSLEDMDDGMNPLLEANPELKESSDPIDIDKELKWFNQRFEGVPVEVQDTLIEQTKTGKLAFGQFRLDSILLSEAGIAGTLYHEAYHRVSLAYLTPKQRESIYNEARIRYNMKDASDFKIEERLAEEFRYYVIKNGNVEIKDNFITRLFKRIWSGIKSFFLGKNALNSMDIDKLFRSIQNGKFRYSKALKENVARLKDKSYNLEIKGHNFQTIDTRDQMRKVARGLAYMTMKLSDATISLEKIKDIKYKPLEKWLQTKVNTYNNIAAKNPSQAKQALQYASLYQELLDNPKQVYELVSEQLSNLNIKQKPQDANDEDTVKVDDGFERFDKTAFEVNAKDNILTTIKFLIGTLHESKKRDPFTHMYSFVDFNEAWSRIMRDLHDMETYDEMKQFMEEKSADDYMYSQLLKRLEAGGTLYQTQFTTSIRLHRHNFLNVLFTKNEDNGNPEFGFNDADVQKISTTLVNRWNEAFSLSKLFKAEPNKPRRLDTSKVKEIVDKYQQLQRKFNSELDQFFEIQDKNSYIDEAIEILNSMSINVDANSMDVLFGTNKTNDRLADFINDNLYYTIELLQDLTSEESFPKDKKGKKLTYNQVFKSESFIKTLAESYAKAYPDRSSDMVPGPDGATYYTYALNSILSDTVRKLKKGDQLFDDLKSVVYNKNSWFLKQLEDDNKRSKFDLITLGGLFEEEAGDAGRQYLKFTELEDFLVKLTLIRGGNIPLPTLADRKSYYLYRGLGKIDFEYIIDKQSTITINKSKPWGELKDKAVVTHDGINTMRTKNKLVSYQHFGNPFTGSGVPGLIQKSSVKEAVDAYLQWLEGTAYKKVNPEQREWILEQIDKGDLDNATLLYMKDKGEYYSHADALKDFVTKRRNLSKETITRLPDDVVNIFAGYVEDEFNRINKAKQELKDATDSKGKIDYTNLVQNYHYSIDKKGKKDPTKGNAYRYQHFTDLNGIKLDINGEFDIEKGRKAIRKILASRIKDTMDYAGRLGIIEYKNGRITANNFLPETIVNSATRRFNSQELGISNIIAEYTINSMMSVIETEKIALGDPAYYKATFVDDNPTTTEVDKIKRSSVLTSTGHLLADYVEGYGDELMQSTYTSATFNSRVFRSDVYDQLLPKHIELYKELLKSAYTTSRSYYEGNITPDKNTVFVFGSNPEGRHGAGAAKIAREQFGAIYGQGEGLQGNAYALPTKDLRVKENKGYKSISSEAITNSIKKLYEVARNNSSKQFKVAYRNTTDQSLNGYTGLEMIDMFVKAGDIPSNIVFSKEWVDTGLLGDKINEGELEREATALAKRRLSGYKNVDQTDAQVFISPSQFRSLSIRLGEWSDIKQKAFDILNSDEPISQDLDKEVAKLVMQPLKLVSFGLNINEGNAVPIYDKMSLATLFRRFTKDTELDDLLDRMEAKGKYEGMPKIHEVKFDTAVKVGNKITTDFYTADGKTNFSNLETYTQQFSHLRRQLVTDPHNVSTSLFGTQAKKVGIMNIIKEGTYTIAGKEVKGQDIIDVVNASIGNLSDRGKQRLLNKLGVSGDNYKYTDDSKLIDMMHNDAIQSDMADAIVEALVMEDGQPFLEFDAFADRKWMQARMISMVNKHTVDLKLPGNQYIQMSNIGLHSVETDDSLKLLTDDGFIEAQISISLFKDVIPNYESQSFERNRDWLYKNKEVMKGLGFRIPTQGQNSMPPLKFVKVLPEQVGDVIVLPAEFTTLTGSDFDIDKLFVVRYNYVPSGNNVKKIEFIEGNTNQDEVLEKFYNTKYGNVKSLFNRLDKYIADEYEEGLLSDLSGDLAVNRLLNNMIGIAPELFTDEEIDQILQERTDKKYTLEDYNKLEERLKSIPTLQEYKDSNRGKNIYDLNSKSAVENRLLDGYLSVLTNNAHALFTQTPLDSNTAELKKLASKVKKAEARKEHKSLSTALPEYQAEIKAQYTGGKFGIAPFALNNVHHALAQQAGLLLNYNLGIGNVTDEKTDLSKTYGIDNIAVSDWLSALIDANVDIAKDPYIFTLNVNDYTYDVTNLLIRAGVGRMTFKFLSQPILKELAIEYKRSQGKIGVLSDTASKEFARRKELLVNRWEKKLGRKVEKVDVWEESQLNKDLDKDNQTGIDYINRQLNYLDEFDNIKFYAEELFNVVLASQVDTKKFGKNLVEVKAFINKLNKTYNSGLFENLDKLMNYDSDTESVLGFDKTSFLSYYLNNSVLLVPKLFQDKSLQASSGFLNTHDALLEYTNSVYSGDTKYINLLADELYAGIASHFFTNEDTGLGITSAHVKKLFFGQNSFVNTIQQIKSGTKFPELKENLLIKLFNTEFSKNIETTPSFITIPSSKANDKWTKDDLIAAWEELFTSDNDQIKTLARALFTYSFFTSGFKQNLFTFFNFIPPKAMKSFENANGEQISFNEFIKGAREQFNTGVTELMDNVLDDIFLNNWQNKKLVPRITSRAIIQSKNIKAGDKSYIGVAKISFTYNNGMDKSGEPMYPPFLNFVENKTTNYIMKLIGLDKNQLPIYKTVNKKGYTSKGRIIKEYGTKISAVQSNNLPTIYSDEVAIQEALKSFGGTIISIDYKQQRLNRRINISEETVGDVVADNEVKALPLTTQQIEEGKNREKEC